MSWREKALYLLVGALMGILGWLLGSTLATLHGQEPFGKVRLVWRHHVAYPDTSLTPGAVATQDTAIVCHTRTKAFRHTTEATKRQVYEEYGMLTHRQGQYEVDHEVPIELGGADTITNLWPQPALPKPGFHEKDLLENRLHRMACTGEISLDSAQRWIAHDWYAGFHALIGAWPK